MSSNAPIEEIIRAKITEAFKPQLLEIHNDSHRHAHHAPMQGSTSKETHFRLVIISDAFKSKMQPARHRMVYALLTEEMAREGGIHALQLRTLTPEEQAVQDRKAKDKADKEAAAKAQSTSAHAETAVPTQDAQQQT